MSDIDWAGRARVAGVITWLAYAILILQQVTYLFLLGAPWIVWVGKVLPLLVFLPGMLRDNLRSYIWLCFVSLYPFMSLVILLFAQPDYVLHWLGMVAVVVLFIAAMMYVRWRARALRQERGEVIK
jgi:uncharacterized membrane protein